MYNSKTVESQTVQSYKAVEFIISGFNKHTECYKILGDCYYKIIIEDSNADFNLISSLTFKTISDVVLSYSNNADKTSSKVIYCVFAGATVRDICELCHIGQHKVIDCKRHFVNEVAQRLELMANVS